MRLKDSPVTAGRVPAGFATDPDALRERIGVFLLRGEPAGKVISRAAGMVEVNASLGWRHPGDMPREDLCPALPGRVRADFEEFDESRPAARGLRGTLRALDGHDLGAAVDAVLRSLTVVAARTGAVLETRVVRRAEPWTPPAPFVERLALDLRDAGFGVRFGPSWSPVPGDPPAAVGAGGRDAEIEAFLRDGGGCWAPALSGL